jgi:hypothetical protein
VTTDCYLTATATTLGLNNIYHQYYSFKLAKGTAAYALFSYTTSPAAATLKSGVYTYTGCFHSHLYNWMA